MVFVEGATPLRLRRSNAKRNVFVRLRETPYFEIRYDIALDVLNRYTVKVIMEEQHSG